MAGSKKGKKSVEKTLLRLLSILNLLPHSPQDGLTVKEICTRLRWEQSGEFDLAEIADAALIRAVQRDLQGLNLAFDESDDDLEGDNEGLAKTPKSKFKLNLESYGVLIEKYDSKWRMKAGSQQLPIKKLTEQQRLVLAMMAKHMKQFMPSQFNDDMRPFFDVALSSSNEPNRHSNLQKYLNSIDFITPGVNRYSPKQMGEYPKNLMLIADSIYKQSVLTFTYKKPREDELIFYKVHPIALVQRGYRYILIAIKDADIQTHLSNIRQNKPVKSLLEVTRQFISHRFASEVGELRYEPSYQNMPTLKEVLDSGLLNFTQNYPEGKNKLTLRFVLGDLGKHIAEQFREQPISADQTIYENEGTLELTATLVESLELQWLLQGLAHGIQVLEGSDKLKSNLINFAKNAYELQSGLRVN